MLSNLRNNVRTIKSTVVDQRQATVQRLRELYREGGVREVYRGMRDFYRYKIARSNYHDGRVDNEHRWSIIEPHLDPEFESLVDIGCADGFFIDRAADRGLRTIGIEGNQSRVHRARERVEPNDSVEVRQMYLSPDNIEELPRADVILFLTVHHHWVRQYGWEDAADMFRVVCDRANLVCYEPPGTRTLSDGAETELAPEHSLKYYTEVIETIFGDNVDIVASEMTAYAGGDRSDPFFVLDTSDYRLATADS